MRIRSIIATCLLVLGMTAASTAVPTAASAALPHCNDWSLITDDFFDVKYMLPSAGANGSGVIDCILSLNDVSNGVFVLQAALNKCHNAGLQTDRRYGQLTKNAVLWGQAASGFPLNERDGVYGPKTRKQALQWPFYRQSTGAFVDCFPPFK